LDKKRFNRETNAVNALVSGYFVLLTGALPRDPAGGTKLTVTPLSFPVYGHRGVFRMSA